MRVLYFCLVLGLMSGCYAPPDSEGSVDERDRLLARGFEAATSERLFSLHDWPEGDEGVLVELAWEQRAPTRSVTIEYDFPRPDAGGAAAASPCLFMGSPTGDGFAFWSYDAAPVAGQTVVSGERLPPTPVGPQYGGIGIFSFNGTAPYESIQIVISLADVAGWTQRDARAVFSVPSNGTLFWRVVGPVEVDCRLGWHDYPDGSVAYSPAGAIGEGVEARESVGDDEEGLLLLWWRHGTASQYHVGGPDGVLWERSQEPPGTDAALHHTRFAHLEPGTYTFEAPRFAGAGARLAYILLTW